ncbi:MAG: hypothetical protein ABIL58_06520 [Pseudomonadota bacterium]
MPGHTVDIRDKADLQHDDIMALNFISAHCPYIFRPHFRCGLRSHIMEVLHPAAVQMETEGVVTDGMRWYPKPVPLKMLRIFRRRFCSAAEIAEEIRRLRIIEAYVPGGQLARSNEFIVHYSGGSGCDLMLCGLQEYADGYELAPWRLEHVDVMADLYARMAGSANAPADPAVFFERLRSEVGRFVDGIRRMILDAGFVPDLAGSRNMLMTRDGRVRLVDINNVSPVHRGEDIYIDDKGYPVCDKSIEALHLMETHLLMRQVPEDDPVYRGFLSVSRRGAVRRFEGRFHQNLAASQRASHI